MSDDIERELEQELHRVLDPLAGTPIPARRTGFSRMTMRALVGSAGAALTVKLLTTVVVAAAAVSVAGVAATGSLNPAVWGQQVQQRVSDCKAELNSSQHGIGDCVSPFANQHGLTVSSAARHHGDANGNANGHSQGNGNGNGNANGHSKDKSTDKPTTTKTTEPPVVDSNVITTTGGHGPGATPQP